MWNSAYMHKRIISDFTKAQQIKRVTFISSKVVYSKKHPTYHV